MARFQLAASLFISAIALSPCSGLMIDQECTDSSECPAHSECSVNQCHPDTGSTCTCKAGFYPHKDTQTCRTVQDVGQYCDNIHYECPERSFCSDEDVCVCMGNHMKSWDGRRCKPRLSGASADNPIFMAVLGEMCDENTLCYDKSSMECLDRRCRCKPDYSPRKRMDIVNEDSLAKADCVHNSFRIPSGAYCAPSL